MFDPPGCVGSNACPRGSFRLIRNSTSCGVSQSYTLLESRVLGSQISEDAYFDSSCRLLGMYEKLNVISVTDQIRQSAMTPEQHTKSHAHVQNVATECTEGRSIETLQENRFTDTDIRLLHSLRLAPGELCLFSATTTSIPLLEDPPEEPAKSSPLATTASEIRHCVDDANGKLQRDFEELINYNNSI